MNIVNAEHVSLAYGTRTLLDDVSLGLSAGEVVGVVGRNGDGKSTLLNLLVGALEPDAGAVVRASSASIGHLAQAEEFAPGASVRDVIVGGEPDHVWAADAYRRGVVEHLLAGIDLATDTGRLSGGERRRVALVALMLGHHDLVVLDEPTNHLDVEAVGWLATHLAELRDRGTAMAIVSHDRWFLDAVCTRVWEVHDATVDAYGGGYAAYVLARVERQRQAAANESRRQNLARKELAWLRRGAPARTSKPKFRIDAATTLIADVPEPRDSLALQRFAVTRLGKDVFDLTDVVAEVPVRTADAAGPDAAAPDTATRRLFGPLTWSIGPGDRIGLVGVNGSGKSTLLRLLAHEQAPTSGRVKQGKTLRIGHLSQAVVELDPRDRVLDSVTRLANATRLETGRDVTATQLLEDFGFTGDRLVTRIGELSGGERRRLAFLRLLIAEPNVLLLDEPTNDLDIDTLTVVEDHLDTWPGTLVAVSHDRYFLERVCDVTHAILDDGRVVMLPGGVEEYLAGRRAAAPAKTSASARSTGGAASSSAATPAAAASGLSAAQERAAKKELARLESRLTKLGRSIEQVHHRMAEHAADHARLTTLQAELEQLTDEQSEAELAWLEAAETLE
ncbi:ABC-F family ATP-binding cassette domain-containing protein [Propioniciclava soli]|uniref:ABC-F family ATP-binding cassette domain-containing protein n=1 Tax=Propioniciclava soli TaxID=2775081 RepID=UPI001E54AB41|nr:ABC-F family ATP-binding cassette domain-containing protein [Propioniciclava soli]